MVMVLFWKILFKKITIEVRLLGVDAPEKSYCNKIKKDEKELHIPAELLLKLGFISYNF